MKYIYLIVDQKYGGVYKASTDYNKAFAECNRLNKDERVERFKITTVRDIASK